MPTSTRPVAVLAAATALTLGLAACSAGHDMGSMGGGAASAPVTAPAGATAAAGAHNDADVHFAMMMIPHHAQAVAMSEIVLAKPDVDPKVRDLATRIKAAQGPEITRMTGWLAGWGASAMPTGMAGMSGMGAGDGMLSAAELAALQQASGAQAATLFLSGMIGHHEGAVTMAQQVLGAGQNADVKALAQDIVTAQNAEIAEMKGLQR